MERMEHMNFRTQAQIIRNTTSFFYDSYCTFFYNSIILWLGRGIDLIISVSSGSAHPPPWDCFWIPGSWVWPQWWAKGVGELGDAGNGSQVLGHHLPPGAPAEIPSSWEVLIESRTLQLWLASLPSSRRPFSLGPQEIWLLSHTYWWPRRRWENTLRSYLPNTLCRHFYSSAPGLCWASSWLRHLSSALKWPQISVGPSLGVGERQCFFSGTHQFLHMFPNAS